MTKPIITLKNIQHSAFASEETHCYNATLFVDGEKWGEVGNDGHGGADRFHPVKGKSWADYSALNERIAAEYPKVDCTDVGAPGTFLTQNLEMICGNLVNDHLTERAVKRDLSSKLCYIKPDAEGIYTIPLKQKGRLFPVEQVRAFAEKRHPGITVLNGMPLPEVVALYRQHRAA